MFRKSFRSWATYRVVTQIVENCNEYGKPLYMCFIDYIKAFDSLFHEAIWETLEQQGINKTCVTIIHDICIFQVRSQNMFRARRTWNSQAKRSSTREPFSVVFFESIFRRQQWENKGVKTDVEYLSHVRFADDIVAFAENALEKSGWANYQQRVRRWDCKCMQLKQSCLLTEGNMIS